MLPFLLPKRYTKRFKRRRSAATTEPTIKGMTMMTVPTTKTTTTKNSRMKLTVSKLVTTSTVTKNW